MSLDPYLHPLYWDLIPAVGARLQPHGTLHILVPPHHQELDVLATLCALDVSVLTDLGVRLKTTKTVQSSLVLDLASFTPQVSKCDSEPLAAECADCSVLLMLTSSCMISCMSTYLHHQRQLFISSC